MRKIAVLTDIVDPGSFFSVWRAYYGDLFGSEHLHVVTYSSGGAAALAREEYGSVINISEPYNNNLRSKFLSSLTTALLQTYDIVLRVDVDEILVPDRRVSPSLREYMESLTLPYVTAFGLDIISSPTDHPLDLSAPIVNNQRKFAYPNCSLNKTCVVSIPTRWVGGFHYCNHYPVFKDLYLLHLRLADLDFQVKWNETMRKSSPSDSHVQTRYVADLEKLSRYRDDILTRPLKTGWDGVSRPDYMGKFFSALKPEYRADQRLYVGEHFHDNVLVELPADLCGFV